MISLVLILLLAACSSHEEVPTSKATPVLSATVALEDVPLFLESVGKLNASTYVAIFPQVSGMLLDCCVKEGSAVHKGDVLFKIDPQPYLVVLRQAKAQLALDQSTLDTARKKLSRYESLLKKDLISQQEWDELSAHVAAAEAVVEQDSAKLQQAKRDLSHCNITAPVNGRMGRCTLDAGNLVVVGQSTPLTTVSELNPISVAFTLTEKEFHQLNNHRAVGAIPLEMCSLCHSIHAQGKITYIDHNFNPQTGLLHLGGSFPNPNKQFLSGQNVRIKIPVTILSQVKVIPASAVKINQIGPYVFIIKADNTIELRQVILGEEFDNKVVVTEGLQAGERIVTEGHARLFPGILVEVCTAPDISACGIKVDN